MLILCESLSGNLQDPGPFWIINANIAVKVCRRLQVMQALIIFHSGCQVFLEFEEVINDDRLCFEDYPYEISIYFQWVAFLSRDY